MRARKVVVTLVTHKTLHYIHMNINKKAVKKCHRIHKFTGDRAVTTGDTFIFIYLRAKFDDCHQCHHPFFIGTVLD